MNPEVSSIPTDEERQKQEAKEKEQREREERQRKALLVGAIWNMARRSITEISLSMTCKSSQLQIKV